MEQHLVLALREVVEQARLSEAVGLQVVPNLVAKVALVKIDVKDADHCACLVLLVSNFFVNPCDLEVIKYAARQHKTNQCLIVE